MILILLTFTGRGQEQPKDWLIDNSGYKSTVENDGNGKDLVLSNGLVKRVFRLQPNVACTGYENLSNGQQLLRAVKPEAVLVIDGEKYHVGGLYGQKEQAYLLPEWVDSFTANEHDFQLKSHSVSEVKPFINWKKTFWARNTQPARGKVLTMAYISKALKGIEVNVNYELYDGIPLIVKSLTIKNNTDKSVVVNRVINEVLAIVEEESAVVGSPEQMKKQHGIYFETNYAFNNAMRYDISDQTTHWKVDSTYTSQVNYNYQTPCLLEVYPEKVSAVELHPGEKFNSVRTHELLLDSYDRERRGLAIRQMYATVAPWTNQNPIFMHLVSRNDEQVKTAIEQCAETGYEALILSFGSHCNMEDTTTANIQKWKDLADLAHSKGIKIGSYSLFSSRRISDEHDVIDPVTGKPNAAAFFGHAPCLGSNWGLAYINKLKYFMSQTGFDIFENDGPYPGDVCASTTHPGHANLDDSQWRQMELQKELYRWCSENGIYVNAPDWYFLDGTNKIALGYREVNFSLPRDQQKILNRQNIYDGTWEKTPSMGWGFVPLTRYQGGGEEAVLEPLERHLDDYKQLMMQYYGAGVQACYRGPRLYDTEKTKQVVTETINWYKQHREILNSDIIHLRRADGRDWDGLLHVDPAGKEKGLLMLFNPLD
ncbi:MAG: alpha-galactosidase, partial [Bacteroidales bacterium]|nr:alpha-galactosidase [Bacteroidales bacterium]